MVWEPSIFDSVRALHENISRMQKIPTVLKLPVIIVLGLEGIASIAFILLVCL